jgi:hypothetical protein
MPSQLPRSGEVQVGVVPALFLLARRVHAHLRQLPQRVVALGGLGEAALREGARGELLRDEAVAGEQLGERPVVHQPGRQGGDPGRLPVGPGLRHGLQDAVEGALPDVAHAAGNGDEPDVPDGSAEGFRWVRRLEVLSKALLQ